MIIVLKPSATEEQITKFTNMLKESYDVKVNKCGVAPVNHLYELAKRGEVGHWWSTALHHIF